jgi:hypothetical protein
MTGARIRITRLPGGFALDETPHGIFVTIPHGEARFETADDLDALAKALHWQAERMRMQKAGRCL